MHFLLNFTSPKNQRGRKNLRFSSSVLTVMLVSLSMFQVSCGAPKLDGTTLAGKSAIYDHVNISLTNEDCDSAISSIDVIYNSEYSDNEARLLRAGAYGCKAGINFFDLLEEMTSRSLGGTEFWKNMTLLFPSTLGDGKQESALQATDALLSTLNAGTVIGDSYKVNAESYNPGSVISNNRTKDSNFYLVFVSMAGIGTIQNRYGSPNAEGFKTVDLPWISHDLVDEDGCAYTAAILNFLDGLSETASSSDRLSSVADAVASIKTGLDAGCALGCFQCTAATGITVSCSTCTYQMRDRSSCSGSTSAVPIREACAAAGLVNVLNTNTDIGWLTAGAL